MIKRDRDCVPVYYQVWEQVRDGKKYAHTILHALRITCIFLSGSVQYILYGSHTFFIFCPLLVF